MFGGRGKGGGRFVGLPFGESHRGVSERETPVRQGVLDCFAA